MKEEEEEEEVARLSLEATKSENSSLLSLLKGQSHKICKC